MELDKNKLLNAIVERSNVKINEMQAQVILLESQLQLALEINKQLQEQLDKTKKKESKSDY